MPEHPKTHQQRWRARLRETHDRVDIYLPKASAETLRRALIGKETLSEHVARLLEASTLRSGLDAKEVVQQEPMLVASGLAPETRAFAALRAMQHGVSIDDFLLAAMRGVSSQTTVMIKGLAAAGRRDSKDAWIGNALKTP